MSKYQLVHVSGDGACLFHSVSGYLSLDKNRVKVDSTTYTTKRSDNPTSSQLRQQTVEWLQSNLDFQMPSTLTIRDEIMDDINYESNEPNPKYTTLDGYFQYMKKKSSYGGQLEITALSNLLQRTIRTYVMRHNKLHNIGLGYVIPKSEEIYLYHNSGVVKDAGIYHFEILYPKKRGVVVTKTKLNTLLKKTTSKPKKTSSKPKKTTSKPSKQTPKQSMRKRKPKRKNTKRKNTKRKNTIRRNK